MRRIEVLAPFSGRVVPLEEVPDPVFSEKMLGDGLAVEPTEGVAVAPVKGEVIVFHSHGHAFVIQTSEGVSILVHVGLDTVKMHGRGFVSLAQVGQQVEVGQELVHFDLATIAATGYSPISPVIVPDLPSSYIVEKTTASTVRAGQDVLFTVSALD